MMVCIIVCSLDHRSFLAISSILESKHSLPVSESQDTEAILPSEFDAVEISDFSSPSVAYNLAPLNLPLNIFQSRLPFRPTLTIPQNTQLIPALQKPCTARPQLRYFNSLLFLNTQQLLKAWLKLNQRGRSVCVGDGEVFER
jgi:hypothetical protein